MKMNVREMHSRKPQLYRTRISDEFKQSRRLILVTSDVSARGMNYPDVTLVIQVQWSTDDKLFWFSCLNGWLLLASGINQVSLLLWNSWQLYAIWWIFPCIICLPLGFIPLLQKRAINYLNVAYFHNYFQQMHIIYAIIMEIYRWAYHLTGSNIYIVLEEQDVKAKKVKVSCWLHHGRNISSLN